MKRAQFFKDMEKMTDDFEICNADFRKVFLQIIKIFEQQYVKKCKEVYLDPDEIDTLILMTKECILDGKLLVQDLIQFKEKYAYPKNAVIVTDGPEPLVLLTGLII